MGIKETQEAIKGLFKLAALMAKLGKDGIQPQDFAELIAKLSLDEEFKQAMLDAYQGCGKIPAEIKDLSLSEGLQLVPVVIDGIKEFGK